MGKKNKKSQKPDILKAGSDFTLLDCLRVITEHTPAFMTPSLPENQRGKAVLTEKPEATDGKEIDQETEEWPALLRITQIAGLILELVYSRIIVARSSPDSKSAPALRRLVRGRSSQ